MTAEFDQVDRIYCMDCWELLSQLPNSSVDLIVTDPPYGIKYQNGFTQRKHKSILGDDGIEYARFALECFRVLKENTHAYFFSRYDQYPEHFACLKYAGFQVKNCLVIEKGTVGGIGDLKGSFASNAEWVIFCHKGRREFEQTELLLRKKPPTTIYRRRLDTCWFGNGYPKASYNSAWQKKNAIRHPTIKSVECCEWLIQLSTAENQLVLDPFLGTGTSAIAAKRLNRRYIGCEIDKEYFDIAERRLAQ